jgi:hypothetical protein
VSSDRKTWKEVECGKTYTANNDMFTKVTNMFDNPVLAAYVRLLPQSWYGWMSMRAGLLLCERPCVDKTLNYPMADSLLSITKGALAVVIRSCHSAFTAGHLPLRPAVLTARFTRGSQVLGSRLCGETGPSSLPWVTGESIRLETRIPCAENLPEHESPGDVSAPCTWILSCSCPWIRPCRQPVFARELTGGLPPLHP